MTRQLSAHEVKTGRIMHRSPFPAEGTVLRNLYDRFRRGEEIDSASLGHKSYIEQLSTLYGMEFNTTFIPSPHGRRPRRVYRLAGEWDGGTFVPIERILQDDMVKYDA